MTYEKDETYVDRGPDAAARHNQGKPRLSLVDRRALWGLVDVLEDGAQKYEAENWRRSRGTADHAAFVQDRLDSIARHLRAVEDGAYLDPESGRPHFDHVAANVMFLREYARWEHEEGAKMVDAKMVDVDRVPLHLTQKPQVCSFDGVDLDQLGPSQVAANAAAEAPGSLDEVIRGLTDLPAPPTVDPSQRTKGLW